MDDLRDSKQVPEATFDAIHDNALPSHEKNATSMRWLLDRHNAGDEGITDHSNHSLVQKSLVHHGLQKAKGTLPANQKNLNQFKSISHLTDAMKPHVDAARDKEEAKDKEIVFQNDTHIIRKHTTKDSITTAAKLSKSNPEYEKCNGKATWCVAADTHGGHTLHSTYTESGKHPFYTIEHTANHPDDPHRKYALLHNPARTARSHNVEFRNAAQDNDNSADGIKEYIEDNHSIMHTEAGKYLDHTVEGHFATLKPTEYRKTNSREGQFVDWKKEGVHITRHSNLTTIKTKGNYINNKKEGEHTETFYNGELKSSINYKNDLKHGLMASVHSNGKPEYYGEFVNGQKEGEHHEHDRVGGVISSGNWKNDKKHGVHTYINDTGGISTGEFIDGKEHGEHTAVNVDGSEHSKVMFDHGKKIGRHDYTNSDTGVTVSGNWIDGKRDGLHTVNDNGTHTSHGEWKNDGREGVHTKRDEVSGRLLSKTTYKGGRKNGLAMTWNGSKVSSEGNFVNDLKEGAHRTYDSTNDTSVTSHFKNNIENGTREIHHEDVIGLEVIGNKRKLIQSVEVVNGKKHGQLMNYNRHGEEIGGGQYVNDMKQGKHAIVSSFHSGAKNLGHEHYLDDELHGERVHRHAFEAGRVIENYSHGKKHGIVSSFHDNDMKKLKSSSVYDNDVLNGVSETKDHEGNTITHGNYVNGQKQGIHISQTGICDLVHENYKDDKREGVATRYFGNTDQVRGTEHFKNDELDGESKFWNKNGTLVSHYNYKGDAKIGHQREWHDNGQLKEEQTIGGTDAMRIGKHTKYTSSGVKVSESNYDDHGNDHGMRLNWTPDGILTHQAEHHHGLKHGQWIVNETDGTTMTEMNYHMDKKHGVQKEYNHSGGLIGLENYKNGERHGSFRRYHGNGELASEQNYVNDKKEGVHTNWHANGQKSYEGNIVNDKKEGVHTSWNENGQKSYEANIVNDKKEGVHTNWHANGQKSYEGNNVNDKKEGVHTEWHANGQKSYEGNFVNDKKEGVHTSWYENGQKSYEGNFVNDKWEGVHTNWHANGQKKSEGNWANDNKVGIHRHWYESGNLGKKVDYSQDNFDRKFYSDADNVKESISKFKKIIERG